MKCILLLAALLSFTSVSAQTDPVVMTINGKPVTRSEFEYSYNKNNSEGVIDRKSVKDYVPLFVNYKLKVQAAIDAGLDTVKALKSEYLGYRDQQIRPSFITDADVEAKAREIYNTTAHRIDSTGGLIKPAHILILMRQTASKDEMQKAKQKIDSIYTALKHGADFAEMARKYSQDPGSARNGGELPWMQRGRLLPDFEKVAFELKKGEMSKPFTSPAGWHIVLMKDRRNFFPYDSVRNDIVQYIERSGLREQIINQKLDSIAKASNPPVTAEQVVDARAGQMEQKDPQLKYLIKEYHDGPLLFEISKRMVWDKAAQDEKGLENYFKKNKKKYRWDEPRFKGIAYHVKTQSDVDAVRNAVKKVPFAKWADVLRNTFNKDSVIRIRVEKGLFKQGDDALVDQQIFKRDTTVKKTPGYPIDAVYGKKLKAPEEMDDVRALVVDDYQKQLEDAWLKQLHAKYPVQIYENVLDTVNKHED